MQYLFVRVVKARDLPTKHLTGRLDPYVEVKLGNNNDKTRHFEKTTNPEWNHMDFVNDDFVGGHMFDLCEIPKLVAQEYLVPQWYRLEDRRGYKVKGELLLALWMGTQAEEIFPEAWHSDDASSADVMANIRSKVCLLPKLWYLRFDVFKAQDLIPSDEYRLPEVFVKASLGNQTRHTKVANRESFNPVWDEYLMFVAVEPFDVLILSVEDKVASDKDEVLGRCVVPLSDVEMRLDEKPVRCLWYESVKQVTTRGERKRKSGLFATFS
ncbi:hypothetical protein R3W88_008462 [Solanum pinnatisectum]|uniref:C2 domain-containing protein n=1 Tax=Solanum pinnatisectum TaxID=50273 RepID=A0AAV9M861_9SOLN|nr:hypothetical protein R3W88_008462 [Solanum pinnatisectum]